MMTATPEIDTLSIVARECYGERGAVLLTVDKKGQHRLEPTEIAFEMLDSDEPVK